MMIAFIVALAMGQRAAAAHSVRGGAAPEHKLEDADGLVLDTWENEQEDRMLANVRGYELQGEDQYSSCPEGYPSFGKLGELLKTWNPNQADVPEAGVIERLQVLNYSDPVQLAIAETLRDCELPFKLVGIPEAEATSKKWTDEYLESQMASCPRCNVMKSESNRFMFWHKRPPGAWDPNWKPPTEPLRSMPFGKWREWTREADANKIGPTDVHYYLTTGVPNDLKTPPATGEFVADDLPFFSTRTDNFFIPDVKHQKGIQCRFGARGIIAESHFDHGKNFVFMIRGRKRYLLNPPRACPALGIISDKAHPSFRHSEIDWSDEADWPEGFADAPALETVLEAGEMLYIPSFWYHYIVSEGFNVQCNARSGLSIRKQWIDETEECMGRELPMARMPDAGQAMKQNKYNGHGRSTGGGRGEGMGRGYGKKNRAQKGLGQGRGGGRGAGASEKGPYN